MTNTKKLLLASGVATALAAASMPSYAIIEGSAGEALLVPFVLYSNPTGDLSILDIDEPSINTIIAVTTPSAIGRDTIPNFFTAPNTTPTNPGPPVTANTDPDLATISSGDERDYVNGLHVFFFNSRSQEELNFTVPTSADDLTIINWGDEVESKRPGLNGVKGYIVITNDKEEKNGNGWGWRDAARFTMFGDAFMIWPTNIGLIDTKIPVLPMSDGADQAGVTVPSTPNNVIFNSTGEIIAASPLTSGMRTNLSNGIEGDYTLFDLTMSNRFLPTIHVIWVDENIGQANTAYVFNDVEQDCSMTLPIANELNVYWTSIETLWPGAECLVNPLTGNPVMQVDDPATPLVDESLLCEPGILPELGWLDATLELCYPEAKFKLGLDVLKSDILYPGFVRFKINEYIDTNKGTPDSAAVAFSIQLQIDVLDAERRNLINFNVLPTVLPVETALGHERGQFNAE